MEGARSGQRRGGRGLDGVQAPFTFLPLGEDVGAPLADHVNAPFVTDFARLNLDRGQPVNSLPRRKIAELCCQAADSIVIGDGDANTLVDLLAWDPADRRFLDEALLARGESGLEEIIQLPVIGGSNGDDSRMRACGQMPSSHANGARSMNE